MVAIEHRQKSAIIATDTIATVTSATTPSGTTTTTTNLTISSSSSLSLSSPLSLARRSSDIENSNDIAALSPTVSTNSSTATATTTTATATSNIIFVKPKNLTDDDDVEKEDKEKYDTNDQDDQNEQDEEKNITSPTTTTIKQTKGLPKMSQSSSETSTATAESSTAGHAKQPQQSIEPTVSKSAVSQRNVDIKIDKASNKDSTASTKELSKKVLKLDLTGKELDEYSIRSPKSPISSRLTHQTSLTTVDVEDRKTLREALYQGIFHRHRRTIFAVGSFLRMLRSRNSSYNTIRSSSEGEDVDEVR